MRFSVAVLFSMVEPLRVAVAVAVFLRRPQGLVLIPHLHLAIKVS
jgi:hypothetical protein